MWTETPTALVREFRFGSFREAFAFVTKVALLAEKLDHHPKIMQDYTLVILEVTTHDAGTKVTEKDRNMAGEIDFFYS